ncbi:MAG: hypothetical protein J2P41_15970 [Blastocatellia bacterium]|nr:hypothetical protein [Blastocatellia bacterium]
MINNLATQPQQTLDEMEILRRVIAKGDLADLTPEQQLKYYIEICRRHKLDPLSRPFDFLESTDRNGKRRVVLYGNKECAAQLRVDRQVSIYKIDESEENGFYSVTAYARLPDGREDLDIGVVVVRGLSAEQYANAIKKAITQAKRRVTLSICGLGMLDETEVDSVPDSERIEGPGAEEIEAAADAHSSGLDQWKCGRALAMQIISLSARLKRKGVSDDTIKQWLPPGVTSRKDLDGQQVLEFINNLNLRSRLITLCEDLSERGISKNMISSRLPGDALLIRDLTMDQARQAVDDFSNWVEELERFGREVA